MESKNMNRFIPLKLLVKCLEEEDVFAIYEDLSKRNFSFVAWGVRKHVVGDSEETLKSLEDAISEAGYVETPVKVFKGGLVGYISYDAVRLWEKILNLKKHPENWPLIEMFEPINVVLYDYQRGLVYVNIKGELPSACKREDTLNNDMTPKFRFYDESLPKRDFVEAVNKVLEYVRDGYAFQVVLSRFYRYTFDGLPSELYFKLREINPSPHTYYIKFYDRIVIGTSPELLYRVEDGLIETYPIAGTRPRGLTEEEDRKLELELMNSEKDRAEHLMLVDLARNDIGKICEYGTVKVEKLMYIEKYSHVQHIVSKVVGKINKRFNHVDILKALFPAGTVSGAPKVFSMNLIEELEEYKRGPYAGVVGLMSKNGNSEVAIAIRSAFIYKDIVRIQAGAGIVYDSVPELEYEETENKLASLKKSNIELHKVKINGYSSNN